MTIADNIFAAACFDQNTIEELEQALAGKVDEDDCATWIITPEQWRASIEFALAEKRAG